MKRDHHDLTLAEDAARRLHELAIGSRQEHVRFAAWLKESPRHIEEVLCATAVDKALGLLDAKYWPDVSQHLGRQTDVVVPLSQASFLHESVTRRRRGWMAAIAATVLCGFGAVLWQHFSGWHEYATAVGEQRTVALDDGSLAYLNTRSKVDVRFTKASREIRLIDGEALFKVEHDATRPFSVRTSQALIRAVGTQFDVYRRPDGTAVSVVEGIVEVSTARGSQRISAGEEAQVATNGIAHVKQANVAKIAGWHQRRLVFDLDSLAEVAAQFNRYNRSLHIRVEGDAAQAKRFSGVFDADDPRSLVKLLATYEDLSLEEHEGEIVVRGRGVPAH